MKQPALSDSAFFWSLARLAAAGLQLPDFLVMTEGPDGTFRWTDDDLVSVARQWEAMCCGEDLLAEAVDMASQIAVALNEAFDSFIDLHGSAATPQQRGWMLWEMRRQVVVAWLGHTGPSELNAAARAWRLALNAPAGPAQEGVAWKLIHELPQLGALRVSLDELLAAPIVPEDDSRRRFCGLYARAPQSGMPPR